MLGTGLGFGELGGVRIVVMEKRTFTGEMTMLLVIRLMIMIMIRRMMMRKKVVDNHLLLSGGTSSSLVGSVGHVEVETCALDQTVLRPTRRRCRPLARCRPLTPRGYRLLLLLY